MKSALLRPVAPPAPLAPLAPLAPELTVDELLPHPDTARTATRAPPSARYEHLPHTQRQGSRGGRYDDGWKTHAYVRLSIHRCRWRALSCGPGTRTPNT